MQDYLSIGSTPCDEPCEQLGPNYDASKARAECRRYIDLIRATMGPEPEGARLAVKSFEHDFGTYMEVVCYFNEENEKAVDYAYDCESSAPATWEG